MHKLASLPGLCIAACLLILGTTVSHSQQPSAADEAYTKWIASVMNAIDTIKPGMTRAEMKKVLAEEGGISTRTHRTYVYKHCPYIKVDIDFVPSDNDQLTEKPEDKIVSISRPYLEQTISD